jgi:hypothetical protein
MGIKRSKASFAATVNGVPQVIPAGYLVEDGHEVLKGREHLFEAVEAHVSQRERRVEQATAAPGEKRTVSRPQRRAPARGKGKDDKAGEGQ